MAVVFPSLKPTARRLTLPAWATSSSKTQSGVTTRRLWGSTPGSAVLSLEFRNCTDDAAALIANAYAAAKGPVDTLKLPGELFVGLNAALDVVMRGGLPWRFSEEAGAPQIESVSPGVSSVSVALVAELQYV